MSRPFGHYHMSGRTDRIDLLTLKTMERQATQIPLLDFSLKHRLA